MECNKEEAIRAKENAERKMQNGDFQGARRIGMKAQRLYPDLDNIAQLLLVCDVLCSAENKLNGSEMDWYGILQIERFSNESVIKKQFRKLALSLHPDKNKFAGAEAAFKLIGDANRVLVDPTKRSLYDMKCGGASRPNTSKHDQSNQNTSNKKQQSAGDNNYDPSRYMSPHSHQKPIFWTSCSTCKMWYQYHRKYQKETLRCQSCRQPFIAHDMGAPPRSAKRVPNQGRSKTVASKNAQKSHQSKRSSKTVASKKAQTAHQSKKRPLGQKSHMSYEENLSDDVDDFVVPSPKRSKGETEMEEASGNGARSSQDDRPSSRRNEFRDNKSKGEEAVMSEKAGTNLENNDEKSEVGTDKFNSNEAPKSDIYVYPDPDFSNFERGRAESAFAVDQIWAIYDTIDSMPRFYAKIRKVITPGFKLQITWLDTSSNNDAERKWCDSGFPVACGRFENGETEIVEDNLMFSHIMPYVNAGLNGCYFVYPSKGETWAVFKNWDLEWSAEPSKHGPPYEFDFVEILTDFIEDVGIGVAYLGKVKGFISVFQRDVRDEILAFTMRPKQLYRFSHQIPSVQLTGQEGEGVPIGSFELDTAALPLNFSKLADTDEISAPKNPKGSAKNGTLSPEKSTGPGKDSNGSEKLPIRKKLETNKFIAETFTPRRSPRDLNKSKSRYAAEDINEHAAASKDKSHLQPVSSSCQPEDEMEFHVVEDESLGNSIKSRKSPASRVIQVEPYDFKMEKSEDKFQVDQIWALHSDEDRLPKNYCQVKKIDRSSSFRLHVALLESVLRKSKPASCGIFKVKDGEREVLPLTAFSHQVKARQMGSDSFEIYPKKGEIWALKRTGELTCSDKEGVGECDIIEVIEVDNGSVKVVVLKHRKEHIFVSPKRKRTVSMDIKRLDFYERCSHQCLAFHMGDEDSRLRGFWQLDPSSVPGSVIVVE